MRNQGLQRRVSRKVIDMCAISAHICAFSTDMCTTWLGRPGSRLPSDHRCLLRFTAINTRKARVYCSSCALLTIRAPQRRVECQPGLLLAAKAAKSSTTRATFSIFLLGLVPRSPHFVKVQETRALARVSYFFTKPESTRRHP